MHQRTRLTYMHITLFTTALSFFKRKNIVGMAVCSYSIHIIYGYLELGTPRVDRTKSIPAFHTELQNSIIYTTILRDYFMAMLFTR